MAAVVCSVVGCLVILRRMAFLGDALSHAMIAGVAGGYLFMKLLFNTEAHAPSMLLGSLMAAVVTVASIGFVSRVSRVKEDTAIGIMYTGVFAAGVVLVSIFRNYIHIDLVHFIMGDVLGVADQDLWVAAIAAALVLSVIVLFYRQFQLTSFDPVMAASIGMPVVLIDYALTTCVSLVVVSAVSMVGVILVVGLLITPAATAYLLCDRLDRMMVLAAVFGVTSVVGGLYLCIWLDSSGGGAVMLFCTFQFLVVLILAPRYGLLSNWLRLKRMVPQQLIEDVLGSVLRFRGRPAAISDLSELLATRKEALAPAVKSMVRDRAARQPKRGIFPVPRKVRRRPSAFLGPIDCGRPTYATSVWHRVKFTRDAHELEHVHDVESVAYLDDLLGHPTHDPHGSEIPENTIETNEGMVYPISSLREGKNTAKIMEAGKEALFLNLHPGEGGYNWPSQS